MEKFKVGDKVKIIDNTYCRSRYPGAELGRTAKVAGFDGMHYWIVDEKEDSVFFDGDQFELIESKVETSTQVSPSVQVGGTHYSKLKIDPRSYGKANGLDFDQINVVKYVTRFKDKNGIEDLKKARHYIDLMIEDLEKTID